MKNLIIISAIILTSCTSNSAKAIIKPIDSTSTIVSMHVDSMAILRDSIKILKAQLFTAQYKVERVKYYLNICKKNPAQSKYLKGWVNRAVQ